MSKAVVYTGSEYEFQYVVEVTHVTVADGLTLVARRAFYGCSRL